MSDSLKTPLTVAKLKALCTLNDLPTSGKKLELINRLLESGVSHEELKIENYEEEINSDIEDELEVESFSLEDEDSETIAETEQEESEESQSSSDEDDGHQIFDDYDDPLDLSLESDEDSVIEAEIMEAEIIEDEPSKIKPVESKLEKDTPPTLLDLLKQPRSIAILCAIVILGGGGYWFFAQSLEAMAVDTLNYGDEMRYIITDGEFLATEEFIEPVVDFIGYEDEICRLELDFSGIGSNSITQGTSADLVSQSSTNKAKLLGAVPARGSYGGEWLTIESVSTYKFNELTASIFSPITPGSDTCDTQYPDSTSGYAELDSRTWSELSSRSTIASEINWKTNIQGDREGIVHSYGASGILGDIDVLGPSVTMITQPIELKELFGNDFIDNEASGSNNGWNWRVLGTDTISGVKMWKVVATQADLEQYCLGSATLNLWIEPNNPWPTQQEVDVSISGANADRQGCSASTQFLGDRVLPEGELRLSHTFTSTSLTRGTDSLDFGATYDNRPRGNELGPTDEQKFDWAASSNHAHDNSTLRGIALEDAVECFETQSLRENASGARTALQDNGYVYRSTQEDTNGMTAWNISWIDEDNAAGWVTFNQSGPASDENCTYTTKGLHDESSDWNKEGVPDMVEFAYIEDQLTSSGKYPGLLGEKGIFTSAGEYHDDVRVGHLVVTPTSSVNEILSSFIDTGTGASTMDITREWSEGQADHRTDVLVELNDGRVLGWNYIKTIS